jgi:hypothetical protein
MRYASATTVPVDRSKAEIERMLQRYGASEVASGWKSDKALIQFRMRERVIRFVLPLPAKSEFTQTPNGRERHSEFRVCEKWEQGCRQRWRALALTIKAKLESSESDIETFESAFMAQIVMPNGKTVAEEILPAIEQAYSTNKMPKVALLTY